MEDDVAGRQYHGVHIFFKTLTKWICKIIPPFTHLI